MGKLYRGLVIPDQTKLIHISDEQLTELSSRIKPIITVNENVFFLKDFNLKEIRQYSFLRDIESNIGDIIDPDKLKAIKDFLCLHHYGYYGMFRPTIASVLAQIPQEIIKDINAFEIVEQIIDNENEDCEEIYDAGYHLSKVRTYQIKR